MNGNEIAKNEIVKKVGDANKTAEEKIKAPNRLPEVAEKEREPIKINKIIKLQYPIPIVDPVTGDTKETDVLEIGRLKLKHVEAMPKNLFKNKGKNISPVEIIPVVAILCNIPIDAARELDFADMDTVAETIQSFLESTQVVGKP